MKYPAIVFCGISNKKYKVMKKYIQPTTTLFEVHLEGVIAKSLIIDDNTDGPDQMSNSKDSWEETNLWAEENPWKE